MAQVIKLWYAHGLFAIVHAKTGIVYQNQTGGVHLIQAQAEGILAPLNSYIAGDWNDTVDGRLSRLLNCVIGLKKKDADAVDKILSLSAETRCMKMDRSKLASSQEAWLHVRILKSATENLEQFGGSSAVLTWENSD